MIVVWSSVRGSPGATSWSLMTAAAWPTDTGVERVVLEADLDGGVLGARYGLGVDPGVVSLIAAMRRLDGDVIPVEEHGRTMGDRLWVVPGPETGEQASVVWTGNADGVAEQLAADGRIWSVDAGRLTDTSATIALARQARLAVVVCGEAPEDLVQVPARVATLASSCESVGLLVVGRPPYSLDELRQFAGTQHVWRVAASDRTRSIAGAVLTPGRARRSWLWRSALDLGVQIERVVLPIADGTGRSSTGSLTSSEVA